MMGRDLLSAAKKNWPDNIFLKSSEKSLSFKEADLFVSRLAEKLQSFGVTAGERIAFIPGFSIESVLLFFALIRAEAVPVLLNSRSSSRQVNDYLVRSGASVFITAKKGRVDLSEPVCKLCYLEDLFDHLQNAARLHAGSAAANAGLLLLFTSGTAGKPKGVFLDLNSLGLLAERSNKRSGFGENDCWILSLPFFHVGGLGILIRALVSGGAVFLPASNSAETLLSLIKAGAGNYISLVPEMLKRLIVLDHEKTVLKNLKCIMLGGAASDSGLLEQVLKNGLPVVTTYGMTETGSHVTALSLKEKGRHLETAGTPLEGIRIKIVDQEGCELSANQTGRIVVYADTLYYGLLSDDGSVIKRKEDFYKTNDRGSLDPDGYLRVDGRIDRVYISGGENVSCEYIEKMALEAGGIREAALIDVKDSKWGRSGVLFVVPDSASSFNVEHFQSALKAMLASYQYPQRIITIKTLPRTLAGKVDYECLKEQAGL
ncbi:MAG: hypothetical protein D6719_05075 [Candidatus Dadabacteria bacterium]|nr:MAG: hypothetical protein D6719_05075 [Candidatus Dadabacteria bacterium]